MKPAMRGPVRIVAFGIGIAIISNVHTYQVRAPGKVSWSTQSLVYSEDELLTLVERRQPETDVRAKFTGFEQIRHCPARHRQEGTTRKSGKEAKDHVYGYRER